MFFLYLVLMFFVTARFSTNILYFLSCNQAPRWSLLILNTFANWAETHTVSTGIEYIINPLIIIEREEGNISLFHVLDNISAL